MRCACAGAAYKTAQLGECKQFVAAASRNVQKSACSLCNRCQCNRAFGKTSVRQMTWSAVWQLMHAGTLVYGEVVKTIAALVQRDFEKRQSTGVELHVGDAAVSQIGDLDEELVSVLLECKHERRLVLHPLLINNNHWILYDSLLDRNDLKQNSSTVLDIVLHDSYVHNSGARTTLDRLESSGDLIRVLARRFPNRILRVAYSKCPQQPHAILCGFYALNVLMQRALNDVSRRDVARLVVSEHDAALRATTRDILCSATLKELPSTVHLCNCNDACQENSRTRNVQTTTTATPMSL
jgi:hypothetical protein